MSNLKKFSFFSGRRGLGGANSPKTNISCKILEHFSAVRYFLLSEAQSPRPQPKRIRTSCLCMLEPRKPLLQPGFWGQSKDLAVDLKKKKRNSSPVAQEASLGG